MIDFGVKTEINGANVSRNWIYVNVTFKETNFKNITYWLYNSTSLVNRTTYTTQRRVINWTNLPLGNYSYNVTIYDRANNRNSTSTRQIQLIP